MRLYSKCFLCIFLILFSAISVFSQTEKKLNARVLLDQGITLYGKSSFVEALLSFRKIILDPEAGDLIPEAFYFTVLCYMGTTDYNNAEKTVDAFLEAYPGSPRAPDIRYQRGRIYFLKKDYETAVKAFQVFLEMYPGNESYSSALYWAAESLFQLGQLENAERLFRQITEKYTKSIKYEASQYRLSLIDLKYREEELLLLLKWSHEESLKTVEEFQRREKTYEQALYSYQKKISDLQSGKTSSTTSSISGAPLPSASVSNDITTLQSEIRTLKTYIAELEAKIASSSTVELTTTDAKTKTELLKLKEEALALKEFYLNWLIDNLE